MYEKLLKEADDRGLTVIEKYPFRSPRIRGLCCARTIAISEQVDTTAERTVILCEELTHADRTVGNILNDERKERRVREETFDRLIGPRGLVEAYLADCRAPHEVADYLNIPEDFLQSALQNYRQRYGLMTEVTTEQGRFALRFEPTLRVFPLP